MPILNFLNGVKNAKGDISKINVNSSIDFASLSGTFISGVGDFVNLFELSAMIIILLLKRLFRKYFKWNIIR